MRKPFARCLWIAVLFVPALGVLLGGGASEQGTDPISRLVQQLGNPEFVKRNSAAKELVALGETAVPALQKAALASKDLETRRRARQLIRAILPKLRKSKSLGIELVLHYGGQFDMGSPTTERYRRADETQHEVRITEPFYLGVQEVTQEEYKQVMGSNPSWFASTGQGRGAVVGIDTKVLPVENVTWFDAIEFCNRLSQKDGLPPYYQIAEAKVETGAITRANVTIAGGNGYRLPTEAEWEFACREWSITPFHFGAANSGREANVKPTLGPAGGYGGPAQPRWRANDRPTKVGTYPPNSHGLADMHGNVEEWCWDWYDKDYYTQSPRSDPAGPKTGTHKVARGGSWLVLEGNCRSASRFFHAPGERGYYGGFRIARSP